MLTARLNINLLIFTLAPRTLMAVNQQKYKIITVCHIKRAVHLIVNFPWYQNKSTQSPWHTLLCDFEHRCWFYISTWKCLVYCVGFYTVSSFTWGFAARPLRNSRRFPSVYMRVNLCRFNVGNLRISCDEFWGFSVFAKASPSSRWRSVSTKFSFV